MSKLSQNLSPKAKKLYLMHPDSMVTVLVEVSATADVDMEYLLSKLASKTTQRRIESKLWSITLKAYDLNNLANSPGVFYVEASELQYWSGE